MISAEKDFNAVSNSKIEGFVTPAYDGHCISNIPGTVMKVFNLSAHSPLHISQVYETCDGAENVVFLLLDGMGSRLLEHADAEFGIPSFKRVFSTSFTGTITSVFPSTTSTALTTLHTGLTPQEHGILGYTSYFSDFGSIVNMLKFIPIGGGDESFFERGMEPWMVVPGITIHDTLKRAGIDSFLYVNNSIKNNGLSTIINRGAEVVPYFTPSDMFIQLRKNLVKHRSHTFHFVYLSTPDRIAHMRGPFTPEFAGEVDAVLYQLKNELYDRLDSDVARGTALIVSADHGHAQVKAEHVFDLGKNRELSDMLGRPPTGDSRAFFMQVRPGLKGAVLDYFDRNLKRDFSVFESEELLKKGIFGSGGATSQTVDSIGDLTAVAKGSAAFENSNLSVIEGESSRTWLEGRHGGLSENEMLVPLIVSRIG